MPLHGFLIIDKPLSISSAQAVAVAKKVLSAAGLVHSKGKHSLKIGHAGTLDPLATGVLVLALGEATKLVSYAMEGAKEYIFEVTWGDERSTDDLEGEITQSSDRRPAEEEIKAILADFIGDIEQVPPAYSAIKVAGKRAYALARGGEMPELKARTVHIDSLILENHDDQRGISRFRCACGKGTYIRSLGRDMGRKLGSYGHISLLRRTKVGNFTENDAILLDKLDKIVHNGDLGFIKPPQVVLDDILAHSLSAAEVGKLKQGQPITPSKPFPPNQMVACERDGILVALAKSEPGGRLKPERVFNIL